MKKAVIFDLDGTLLYTLADLREAVNASLSLRGLEPRTVEEIRVFVGNGIKKLMERALPAGSSEEEVAAALADFKAYYAEHIWDKTVPYGGINELLSELKSRGVKLAVLSNKIDSASKALIEHFFPNVFDEIFGERTGIPRKPDPTSCGMVLETLGTTKEETLYVGDSGVDMQTAKNAGLYAAGVTWGFREHEELAENGADVLIDKPEQLLKFF